MARKIMGIPWHTQESYSHVRSMLMDGEHMPPSYDMWLGRVIEEQKRIEGNGFEVLRVEISPTDFALWCHQAGLRPSMDAKASYAASAARRLMFERETQAPHQQQQTSQNDMTAK